MMSDFFLFTFSRTELVFLGYFGIIDLLYALVFLAGLHKIVTWKKKHHANSPVSRLLSDSMPEISLILPVYNEQRDIISIIDCLLNLSYIKKQIIIVNDGSKDNTLDLMQKKLQLVPIHLYFGTQLPSKPIKGLYRSELHPECLVIDKENGTRFDALNAGLNACKSPYFITVDADTFINDESLKALIEPILTSPPAIAIGAIVRIRDIDQLAGEDFSRGILSLIQSVEYIRTFFMRLGLEYTGGNFAFSGAFSSFHTPTVIKAGGFAPTFAHDLEIILRLQRAMKGAVCRIIYLPDSIAWTYPLTSLKGLRFQRKMWHRGLLESMWIHKCLFLNPKYGAFGLFVYPLMFFGEVLAPIVEIAGYLYLISSLLFGTINPAFALIFFSLTIGFSLVMSWISLLIEEMVFNKTPSFKKLARLYGWSLIENLGFRQLTLFWKMLGFISLFFKSG